MGKPVDKSIPIFPQLRTQIEAMIEKELKLGMILIDISYILKTIRTYNSKNKSIILDAIVKFMNCLRGNYIRKQDIIVRNQTKGNKYYLFLSPARKQDCFRTEDFENMTYRIYSLLFNILDKDALRLMEGKQRIKFGYSIGFHSPTAQKQDLLNRLLDMAQDMTKYWSIKNDLKNQDILYQMIKQNNIIIKHQPIVNLNTNQILGYEAFIHGPDGTIFRDSYSLFTYAQQLGLDYDLDWLCKKQIILNASGIGPENSLFINILPCCAYDTNQRIITFKKHIIHNQIEPTRIVFELSDKKAVENQTILANILKLYKDLSFAININRSWLNTNMEIIKKFKISYLKLSMALIRDIHQNKKIQDFIKDVRKMAQEMGAQLIAEGIETKDELNTVKKLGIKWGQGHLFAKAGPAFPRIKVTKNFIQDADLHKHLLSSVFLKRGCSLIELNEYDKAILELSKGLEVDQENIELLYYRSLAYFKDNCLSVAMKELKKLLDLDPANENALRLRTEIEQAITESEN